MLLNAFTLVHVVLSLIGIGSGVVVIYGFIRARTLPGWTKLVLATTAATSATGFLFPFHGFTPALALGVMSLVALIIASFAMYRHLLLRTWRRTYAITAVIALGRWFGAANGTGKARQRTEADCRVNFPEGKVCLKSVSEIVLCAHVPCLPSVPCTLLHDGSCLISFRLRHRNHEAVPALR